MICASPHRDDSGSGGERSRVGRVGPGPPARSSARDRRRARPSRGTGTSGEAQAGRLSEVEYELRALAGLDAGQLRLASFASAAASILPIAIAKFRRRHPIEISVVMADPIESFPMLRAGELDFAISHDPMGGLTEELGATAFDLVHLFDDPMYVALPVGHPLADGVQLDLARFAEEPWMLATTNSCPDSKLFLRACHAAGFEPRIAFQNDDYPAILGFVAAGVGVALVPDMVARGVRDDVVIRALEPPAPSRPIFAAFAAGYRSPAAAAILDVFREVSETWVSDRPVLSAA